MAKKRAVKKKAVKKKAVKKKAVEKKAVKKKIIIRTRAIEHTSGAPRVTGSWPDGNDWRQSGLCSESQADGVPCAKVGNHCEICDRADLAEAHTQPSI